MLSLKRQNYLIFAVSLTLASVFYGLVFFPKNIKTSYSAHNCVSQLSLLPNLHHTNDPEKYTVNPEDELKLGNLPIIAKSVCFEPTSTPTEGNYKVASAPLGLPVFSKVYSVSVPASPQPNLSVLNVPIPVYEPLIIPMTAVDELFTYYLQTDTQQALCVSEGQAILCDIPSLKLEQGKEYAFKLLRQFKADPVSYLAEQKLTTLSATSVTETSIAPGKTVYEKPASIVFKTDKSLKSAQITLFRKAEASKDPVKGQVKVEGNQITFSFAAELARSSSFEAVIDGVRAEDGSSLAAPYSLAFQTSGGPKVTSVNIGKTGVLPGAVITVSFDQVLDPNSNIKSLAKITGAPATVSQSGSQVKFALGSVDPCTDFSISVDGKLTSVFGVSEAEKWSYSSRTRCHTVSTIGYSANGRAINAYSFGSGETMLFIGATHGNERSGGYLMDRFIEDLEANARKIPAGRRVMVVPRVSPDAFAANTRRNARNVDLNRNFPTNDWKPDVTMPGGQLVVGGGGSAPLSEPESKAIASYTLSLRPRLVLTYHAVASNVIANEAGISWSAAQKYSALSGYRHIPKSQTSEVFQYDTTGSYEDWLYEKHGIAALLVEMSSMTNSQFERNKAAMWAVLSL